MRVYREKHGVRLFFGIVRIEFYWWSQAFGFGIGRDDEGPHGNLRIPPLSLFWHLAAWPKWDDQREFSFGIYDWTIRLGLRERKHESRSVDPWWVRGVSLNIPDIFLGRAQYSTRDLVTDHACVVPMPEGAYAASAKVTEQVWKRPRWFRRVRTSVWLEIPNGGIPHAGKGENSWDCGDDGLCGIGGESIEDAIARAQSSVLRDRKRYGMPSPESMTAAQ